MYKCTVISSLYNADKFLPAFINNVLKQSCIKDIQVLLLDAASTDNTENICRKLTHPNISYIRLDKKYTIYETWNKGLDLAESPLVCNWNVDDGRFEHSLALQIAAFDNVRDHIDVVYGQVIVTNKPNVTNTKGINIKYIQGLEPTVINFRGGNPPHNHPMWRKSIHDKIGKFDEQYESAADYEFWLRCVANGIKFKRIETTVGTYFNNPNGISTRPNSKGSSESIKIRERYKNLFQ
jgi:glycosyltransferase involved in cell wall biosynthesis